jgi:DNA-directed RNA polymerase beta subunit
MTTASILKKVTKPKITEKDLSSDNISVGVRGILASTEKLLAVNRGLDAPDERDALQFKSLMTTDRLMRERIKLDADKVRMNLMRRVAKFKSLKPIGVGAFDSYARGLLIGNPLSMPLEEINPMHLVEQARRVTQMGPGGLPSEEAISIDAQQVHPSQFGFISTIEGPENSRAGVDVRLAWGTKLGDDGRIYQKFRNHKTGVMHWLSPVDLDGKTVGLPD